MSKNSDLYNKNPEKIVMYSTTWCPDCRRSRDFMTAHNVDHVEIDIGKDRDAFSFVEKMTRRVRIPTIVFPDGTVMVEPTDEDLATKIKSLKSSS